MKKQFFIFALFASLCAFSQSKKLNVYFASDKFDLDQRSKKRIDSSLNSKSVYKVYLQGHCDSVGSFEYNDALSNKRVQEVKKYLLSKKIDENYIHIKALGKRVLLNGNETENERALNRRVEIEFVPTPKDKIVVTDEPSQKEVEITGQVLDDNNQPIVAEVTLTDANGNEVAATITKSNGEYKLTAVIDDSTAFVIYFNDQSFISSKKLTKEELKGKPLKTVLPKLKGGKKYTLENFNFVGDTSQLLPESRPTLQALYKLMKKNKTLVIEIGGHVNYPKSWGDVNRTKPKGDKYFPAYMTYLQFNQWLSEERAKMVYNYLLKKGIDAKRMKAVGFGSTQMMYPNAENEYEYMRNRRVEIKVVSLK